ncbi:MAG: heparinase II/III family protein, partial [Balneolaceae bacterium]
TREELEERMTRLAGDPVAERILENALSDTGFLEVDIDAIEEGDNHITEALTHGPWSKISGHRMRYWWRPMIQLSDVIREGAFRYAFTGDREAGEKAKEAMLKLASFERWNVAWMLENRFWTYFLGAYTIMPVAYGYDMLHDLLSEEERAFVREALIEKGLKMFHRDMVEMNRMPSHATNHLSVLVTTYGMIATVLHGEDPDNPYMEPYLSGVLEKLEGFVGDTYHEDGSYSEPIGYHGHATNNIVQAFDILERNFGLDYSKTTAVRKFYYMPILGTGRTGQIQDFGDYHFSNPFDLADIRSQWFVHRLKDSFLSSYVKQAWEEGRGGYLGYLWYRDDLEPVSRESLPTSRFFEARGMITRSDWSDRATIVHSRTGPNANHYHYDQGSFQIQTNGQALLTDPGIGQGGYYGNLLFTPYNIQAVAHNVLLIDGDPQSQKPAHYDNGVMALKDWPRALHTFTGGIVDAIESDLESVYKEKLVNYRRTLLYTKGGPLFLHDRVESVSEEGHAYNWAFHIPMEDRFTRIAVWADRRLTVDREHARLTMDVISPHIEGVSIEDNEDLQYPETLVRLDSEPGLTESDFVAVLYPEAASGPGQFSSRPMTEPIETGGWLGAKVTLNGQSDYGLFRTSGSGWSTVAGFTTNASRFTASIDSSGNLVRYYLEGSSFEGHGQSLSSDIPVTAAVLHHFGSTDVEVDASGSTRLSVTVSERPSRVSLDGSSVRYSYDNGRVSLQVPAGRHDIKVH